MNSGIYAILNRTTGKYYIGSAINFGKRIGQHKSNLKHNRHQSLYLQNSWNKYGEDSFEFLVLEYCDREKLIEREQHWIDLTKCYDREYGYNARRLAESNLGYITREETKRKLSLGSPKRKWDTWPHELGNRCKCVDCNKKKSIKVGESFVRRRFGKVFDNAKIEEYADSVEIRVPKEDFKKFAKLMKLKLDLPVKYVMLDAYRMV